LDGAHLRIDSDASIAEAQKRRFGEHGSYEPTR
jgi:hypothetical protein